MVVAGVKPCKVSIVGTHKNLKYRAIITVLVKILLIYLIPAPAIHIPIIRKEFCIPLDTVCHIRNFYIRVLMLKKLRKMNLKFM